VFACSGVADSQLAGNQDTAHAVNHEISVYLWRKMLGRIFQPGQRPGVDDRSRGPKGQD
jgi:hypothetical protein